MIIIALATLTAWGTFVEARYDATAAQKIVYHSVWMYSVMAALAVNLIAVMIDRWPWDPQRHTGFVLAHIGIIILQIGSLVTRFNGIDGSLTFEIGKSARHVVVGQTDFTVYTSMDGSSYTKLFDREVDFFLKPPTEAPIEVQLPDGPLKVVDYLPYAFREEKIVETQNQNDGAAVRFQLQNDRVSLTEWLIQVGGRDAVKDLGPARVVLTSGPFTETEGRNTLVLRPRKDLAGLEYEVHTAREPGKIKKGIVQPGDNVDTGWMGLVLRVLKFSPHAKEELSFKKAERPTPLTLPAIKISYKGSEHWMASNSMLKLFGDQAVFVVTYGNRRIDLNLDLRLKEFRVGRYQGTMRAASYESVVEVPGMGETVISMNEPLKYNGYTFYQSSFEEDEKGQPVASVLSVNRDPGRWLKYLGSLLIVGGSIHMFYFRRKRKEA